MKARFVSESIEFTRGKDPKSAMNIGIRENINSWFDRTFPSFKPRYRINEDLTIDIIHEFEVPDTDIGEFPPYINFHICNGDFMVDYTKLTSLRGCPRIVKGYFSCEGNKLTSLEYFPEKIIGDIFVRDNPGKFTEQEVLEHFPKFPMRRGQKIYSENSYQDE